MNIRLKEIELSLGSFSLSADFTAEKGQWTSILGPSGSGKTSILRIIAGFLSPGSGRVFFGEEDVTEKAAERRGIGFVFQDQALFPHLGIRGNIEFGLRVRGMRKAERRERVRDLLSLCKLEGMEGRRIEGLSGGERQRVALARALAIDPAILLLDEPLAATDASMKRELRVLLRDIQKKRGLLVVAVTHDQEEALAVSDRIILLKEGRIVQEGSPLEIWREPVDAFAAGFIGMANLFPLTELEEGGQGDSGGRWIVAKCPCFQARMDSAILPDMKAKAGMKLFLRADRLRASNSVEMRVEESRICFQAKAIDSEFRGARYLLRCEAGGVEILAESEDPVREGSTILLAFDPADLRLLA